ncbi:MAG: thioredoxin family protein [Planctomycetales bacterium]|nr:thioredoxin family protein [Planctomycetales bacterium]
MTLGRALVLAATATTLAAGALADDGMKKKGPGIPGVPWISNFQEGLEAAKATGRPILLDFWCGT